MSVAEKLMTAAEYEKLPDDGQPTELVRGRIVNLNVPTPRHGMVCSNICYIIRNHVDERDLGRVVVNDSGIITQRVPDTVRGADVAYYSFQRLPKGPLPAGYLDVVPELAFEVRSPSDRWSKLLGKVAEYLDAGVTVVCCLDPDDQTLHLYRADQPVVILKSSDRLSLPDLLPDLDVTVGRFFD